ncbi:MAG: betaine--homocysteine S-methyltransferase [Pseudomonadota bacterium]
MIAELLEEKGVLLADGATGTTLFGMGLESGDAPELWNADQPDKIRRLHEGFVDAGADLILTNSFGGTRHRLKLHHAQDRVFELNKKAAELAREVVDASGRKVVVAGSVGPTGELLIPLGAMTFDEAKAAFIEQIEGLKAGGADVIWIETMSAVDEIRAATEAAAEVGIEYTYTASFDTAGRTMMGLLPSDIASPTTSVSSVPFGLGANCGVGASDLLVSVLEITEANPDRIVIAKANAGIPQVKGDHVHYSGTPELMADYARLAIDAGARIIGGCCGTTAEHLAAMRAAIDSHQKGLRPTIDQIVQALGPLTNAAPSKEITPRRERTSRRRRMAA